MKKVAAVLVVMVLFVSLVSLVFAADAKTGIIKSVDAKAGTVVLTVDGKDESLKADKAIDLGTVKAGDKVEATIAHGMVMSLKAAKKAKAPVGC